MKKYIVIQDNKISRSVVTDDKSQIHLEPGETLQETTTKVRVGDKIADNIVTIASVPVPPTTAATPWNKVVLAAAGAGGAVAAIAALLQMFFRQ